MPETARLDKLEEAVRKTQDSMLMMSKDVHQMNQSITSIATSMKSLVQLQQDMKVMEERAESRYSQLKESDKVLHIRVDTLATARATIESNAELGKIAYNVLLFIAKTLGGATLLTLLSLVIWAIQYKG